MAQNLAIVDNSAPMAISTHPDAQRRISLVKALTGLAEARQASVSAETLKLYSAHLATFEIDDVREVVRKLALQPREEGKSAFPELGVLVNGLEVLDRRRREAHRRGIARQEEIREFWSNLPYIMERAGQTEEQILERWPSMRGTKPTMDDDGANSNPDVPSSASNLAPEVQIDRKMAAAGDH